MFQKVILNFFNFLAKCTEFWQNFDRTLMWKVRMVRSLADRTCQLRGRLASRSRTVPHKFKATTKKRWCPTSFPPRQRNRHRSATQNEPIGWPSLPRHTDADYKEKNVHNRNVRCSANQNQSVNSCQIEPWPHCSKKGVTNLRRLNLRTIHVALQRNSSKKSIWREAP